MSKKKPKYKINDSRQKIREVIEENDTPFGRYFDIVIQFVIFLSIAVFSIETLPNLSEETRYWLRIIDLGCYILFTIEYVARIYASKKPIKFIFSFYGIIDFLAILPFIVGSQFELRILRVLRVLKILSMLKVSKYSDPINRFTLALKMIRSELMLFFIISSTFMFLSATGVYYFEHQVQPDKFASIFHSLWWSIITLTTVGYGDVIPITTGGRIFTGAILFLGLGIVSIPTGLIASALTRARAITHQEEPEPDEKEKSKDESV